MNETTIKDRLKHLTRPLPVLIMALCAAIGAIALSGCAGLSNGSPPNSIEARLFSVVTNQAPPVVQAVTNYIPVTVYHTNVTEVPVTLTNLLGVTEVRTNYSTNTVSVTVTNPVVSQVTNQPPPTYNYTPSPGAQSVTGIVAQIPVYGTLASTAIGGILAVWGWLKSAKKGATASTLAQSIETMREFVKALPNGATYDTALTNWLQQHQAETGTITDVLGILQNDVSNADAKMAAQQVIAAITALNPSAVPAGTAVKAT